MTRLVPFATLLLVAGCATHHEQIGPLGSSAPQPASPAPRQPLADVPVKIGPPYQVAGIWYVPADSKSYDEVGYASWYGPSFHGGATARGERYDMDGVSAAHKTLPLPSYVEVTALDTGRTILVRINDRGPFVGNRIIDLSRGAARQLGIERTGVARVRVRRVDPAPADALALRLGQPAPLRPDASLTEVANLRARLSTELASAAAIMPSRPSAGPIAAHRLASVEAAITSAVEEGAVPRAGAFFVQIAAVADHASADALVARLRGLGAVQVLLGPPYRIRIGPYADQSSADAALAQLMARGYGQARLVQDPGAAATVNRSSSTR